MEGGWGNPKERRSGGEWVGGAGRQKRELRDREVRDRRERK